VTLDEMRASIKRRVQQYAVIDGATGCWLWTASQTYAGYGRLQVTDEAGRSTAWGAHRAAYVAWVGPVPDGLHLDHLCRVRHCVNPRHLEPVTNEENLKRSPITHTSINMGRTHCKHGHEFTAANTYATRGGRGRACRQCKNDRTVAQRAARVAAGLTTKGTVRS
jgi:hypothetical protein